MSTWLKNQKARILDKHRENVEDSKRVVAEKLAELKRLDPLAKAVSLPGMDESWQQLENRYSYNSVWSKKYSKEIQLKIVYRHSNNTVMFSVYIDSVGRYDVFKSYYETFNGRLKDSVPAAVEFLQRSLTSCLGEINDQINELYEVAKRITLQKADIQAAINSKPSRKQRTRKKGTRA